MSNLIQLKNAIASQLAKLVQIPLASEELSAQLYGMLLENIWSVVPPQIQSAIGTATDSVDPAHAATVLTVLKRLLRRHMPRYFTWLSPEQVETISTNVAQSMLSMSATNVTAFTGTAAKPAAPAPAAK